MALWPNRKEHTDTVGSLFLLPAMFSQPPSMTSEPPPSFFICLLTDSTWTLLVQIHAHTPVSSFCVSPLDCFLLRFKISLAGPGIAVIALAQVDCCVPVSSSSPATFTFCFAKGEGLVVGMLLQVWMVRGNFSRFFV